MKRKFENITPSEKVEVDEDDKFFYSIFIANFPRSVTSKKKIRSQLEPLEKKLVDCNFTGFKKLFKNQRPCKGLFLRFTSEEIRNKAKPIIEEFNPNWILHLERGIKRRKIVRKEVERVLLPIEFIVTPLHELPYDQQLKRKEEEALGIYKKMSMKIFREIRVPRGQPRPCRPQRGFYYGTFLPIIGSPSNTYYRNNCEFTCGYYEDGILGVGFLYGNFKDGYTKVADPSKLIHVSKRANHIRKKFEELIQEKNSEKFRVYTKTTHTGFWRTLKIRENVRNECLVIVQVNQGEIGRKEEEEDNKPSVEEIGQLLVSKLITTNTIPEEDDEKYVIKGICVQSHGGKSNAADENAPLDCVYGQPYIIETMMGRNFKISPNSFFQINSKGCERLYSVVRDWLQEIELSIPKEEEEEGEGEDDDTKKKKGICLLDVCCGTGTIGQILCDHVDHVVGIDISESSISDAKENQKLNGIDSSKLEYVCGPAEKTISRVIKEKKRMGYEKFVAIVDPPRSGLHKKVLQVLRSCDGGGDESKGGLDNVIFVSCNMKSMSDNCIQLCKSATKQYVGRKFTPQKYVCVDMFPHCGQFESVMYLKREKAMEKKKRKKKKEEEVEVIIPPPPPLEADIWNELDGSNVIVPPPPPQI